METLSQTPIVRNTDPVSSHLAAMEITAGVRGSQQLIALKVVRESPDHTSLELANKYNLSRYMLARRLPELENGGLIEKGRLRPCKIGKRKAVTWVARGH